MKKIFTMTILVTILFLGLPAFAALAAGDGSSGGNGSGQKTDNAFDIVSSTVENGEKNVNIDREIKFVFSKNIANISVAENNRQCFSMTDSNGNTIPVEVITYDDQLEREKRNDVIIKPEALEEAEEYTIVISQNLQSKNGNTLGKEIKYTFSTPGYVSGEAGSKSSPTGSGSSQWWIAVFVIAVVAATALILLKRKNAQ